MKCLPFLLLATAAISHATPLDISQSLNYDAVGTAAEIKAARESVEGTKLLESFIGDHSLGSGKVGKARQGFTNQMSAQGGHALPDDGVVGNFKIHTDFENFDAASGKYVPAKNCLYLTTAGLTTEDDLAKLTVSLPPEQQIAYSALNLLFVQYRGTSGECSTMIEAHYTDGTVQTIFDTGFATASDEMGGGTLGSAGIAGQGGLGKETDTDPSVRPVLIMDRGLGTAGSGDAAYSLVRNDPRVLWELSELLPLDKTKKLKAITFLLGSKKRGENQLVVFALDATPATR